MLEGDDLTAAVKRAETALANEQKAIDADRRTLAAEKTELQASLERVTKERAELASTVDKGLLAKFDLVSQRRNGVAIAEAKDGICTICHVRLRPQVFNTVRRNDDIIQCDSCNRILYSSPRSPRPRPTPWPSPSSRELGQRVIGSFGHCRYPPNSEPMPQ